MFSPVKKSIVRAIGYVSIVSVFSTAPLYSQDDQDKKEVSADGQPYQTVCPATDGKIKKESFLDYQGKRIYVCCAGCFPRVKEDPEKYLKKIEESGELVYATADVTSQKECPVNNTAIDLSVYEDHEWQRYYFCSKKCKKKFQKNPEKYMK